MYLRIDERDAERTAIVEDTGLTYTFGDFVDLLLNPANGCRGGA